VLQRLKMLVKYDSAELDAAILNAIFGAYVESPYDPELVAGGAGRGSSSAAISTQRAAFHEGPAHPARRARMPILFPGEKINAVTAARPTSNFGQFEGAVLRNAAAGMGISAQQLSQDWSDVNYSSARGALLEAWKTLHRRRTDFGAGFGAADLCRLSRGTVRCGRPAAAGGRARLPRMPHRIFALQSGWARAAAGSIPVAEKKGAVLGMDAGLSTLEAECAENVGEDWEEVLDQRQREIQAFKDRNIPVPSWAGMQDKTAEQVIKDPEVV
jgi:capsid protein